MLPGFLHNDAPHLLWNVFVLAAVGCNAEHYLGVVGYTALLGACILLGNIFTAAFRQYICVQSIGASTAIMGVLAFEIVWMVFNFTKMGWSKWFYALYFFTIFLTSAMSIFATGYLIEFWGHIGGFIAGFIVTLFFYQEVIKHTIMNFGRFLFIGVYAALFVFAAFVLFFRNTKRCYDNICDMRLDFF